MNIFLLTVAVGNVVQITTYVQNKISDYISLYCTLSNTALLYYTLVTISKYASLSSQTVYSSRYSNLVVYVYALNQFE